MIALKNVNKDSKLWLKIVYPEEYEPNKFTMKEAYQCIYFFSFHFDHNSFGTYDFKFNREYVFEDEIVGNRENICGNQLIIRSYNEDYWVDTFRCTKCGS